MSSLESWAYLSRAIEGPSQYLQQLMADGKSADEIADGIRRRAGWIGTELLSQTSAREHIDQPAQDLEEAAKHGYALITPDSPEWPLTALQQSFGHPRADEQSGGYPPHALWVRGNRNLPLLFADAVGFVGTRAATRNGHESTSNLVSGLAKYHYTVISGGAFGIDTAAHEAALANGMPTVAITACGPGRVYPKPNEGLFDRIVEAGGALISEYPPGVSPDRHRFLTRNRLIAALSRGTVVVEAGYRSGALNTLKWVNAFGRHAMAVPGSIMEKEALGTNLAIVKEHANMVLSADHIHGQLTRVGEVDEQLEFDYGNKPRPLQTLSHKELQVYDALPPVGGGELRAEQVAANSGLAVGLTVHLLMDLNRRSLVAREGLLWRRLPIAEPEDSPETSGEAV